MKKTKNFLYQYLNQFLFNQKVIKKKLKVKHQAQKIK